MPTEITYSTLRTLPVTDLLFQIMLKRELVVPTPGGTIHVMREREHPVNTVEPDLDYGNVRFFNEERILRELASGPRRVMVGDKRRKSAPEALVLWLVPALPTPPVVKPVLVVTPPKPVMPTAPIITLPVKARTAHVGLNNVPTDLDPDSLPKRQKFGQSFYIQAMLSVDLDPAQQDGDTLILIDATQVQAIVRQALEAAYGSQIVNLKVRIQGT